jgi:hypothetical protein
MKKIGFIDYYLKEWHADNYPAWITEATNGEMKVCYGYGKIANPHNGVTNEEWCAQMGIEYCATIDEVIEKSDYLIVLSPDNPEMHWELVQKPLRSGKPTYVDKTFAPDKKTAEAIFALAKEHHTPMWSSSALRFSQEILDLDTAKIDSIVSVGSGVFDIYLIHQVEPIVRLMGTDIKQVMYTGTEVTPHVVLQFADGRVATIAHMPEAPFALYINNTDGTTISIPNTTQFFPNLIKKMMEFFSTDGAVVGAPEEQTVTVIAAIEAAKKAKQQPNTWVAV